MDLAILINGDDPNDRLGLTIATQQHRPGPDQVRVTCIGKSGPPQAIVVLGVQVSCEVDELTH